MTTHEIERFIDRRVDQRLADAGVLRRAPETATATFDKGAAQEGLLRWTIYPFQPWRHYKGDLYVIVTKSIDEANGRELVTYRSVDTGHLWTRTLDNFVERIQTHGVDRFTRIE